MIGVVDLSVPVADRARSQRPIEQTVATIPPPGAAPIALGSHRSVAEPDVRSCAAVYRQVALVQFPTDADGGGDVRRVVGSDASPGYERVAAKRVSLARDLGVRLRGDGPVNELFDGHPGVMGASVR